MAATTSTTPATATVVEIERVRRESDGKTLLALDGWRLVQGDHSLVLGPSGSGKSTLLNLVAGLLPPTAGRIEVCGRDLGTMAEAERDRFRGRHIGIVFQGHHLVRALTIADNLRLARRLARLPADEGRVAGLLKALAIGGLADVRPERLSQGERQRAAIARAVVNSPRLILADEPTSALDDVNSERVVALLLGQAAACGASLVIATHDARLKGHFANRIELGGQR